ncbi:MAG: hypothetical protein COA70_00500 [Planctomycetota bacterium]|nr:MAG: hypothetical protein COA70_00500 [Planctomycetota bacterium]
MNTHSIPTFVVVGHVNKGKSSVVATLLEDPSIPIDLVPGTTTEAAAYDFKIDGKSIFRLIDTPGFQEAEATLEQLQLRSKNAGDHQNAIRDFIKEFDGAGRFHDEVELLRPLLQPGPVGLLYVVDASRPYRATHEAEMEILRWVGRPGMALMNRIGEEDHAESWRPVLQQFFSVVRDFNAHEADAETRLRLLATFGELHEDWKAPLKAAVDSFSARTKQRATQSSDAMARFLVESWSHVEMMNFTPANSSAEGGKEAAKLSARYEKYLRKLESDARRTVESVYGFAPLDRLELNFNLTPEDLFDQEGWRLFGLSQAQLTARAAAAGGVAGGVLDLFTGGLSFGAGVALGSVVGAAGVWFGSQRVAKQWTPEHTRFARLFPGQHGHVRAFGPIANDAFAWVLLDRALVHLRVVQHRAHARQGPLNLEDTAGFRVSDMSADQRKVVDHVLRDCQGAGKQRQAPHPEVVQNLARCLKAFAQGD